MAVSKKTATIYAVRFSHSTPLTDAHFMSESISTRGDNTYFSGKKIGLAFDSDDRFLRVTIGDWVGLVPWSNVCGVMIEP